MPATGNPPEHYKEQGDWKVAEPKDAQPRGSWWTVYEDPELDGLEDKIPANLSLKAAFARLQQARAQYRIARADLFPTLTANPYATREKLSPNAPKELPGYPTLLNDFLLGADFSYEVDLWGRVRNEVASAKASRQASAADYASVELSLRAQLAEDYFYLRSDDAQIQFLDRTVVEYQEAVKLTTDLFNGGAAALGDVAQAQAQLENALTQAADIQAATGAGRACDRRAGRREPLALQSADEPAADRRRAAPDRSRTALDAARAPPGCRRGRTPGRGRERADRRGPRRLLSQDLPQCRGRGREHQDIEPALHVQPLLVGGTAGVAPIFEGGRLVAETARVKAVYEEQVADYRNTVLTAYQDVEDNLVALRQLQVESETDAAAVLATGIALKQAQDRYRAGIATYLEVYTAETAALQAAGAGHHHSGAAHERERLTDQSARRRLGSGSACPAVRPHA